MCLLFYKLSKLVITKGKKRKEKKISRIIYSISQNITVINVFLDSLLSEPFPSLGDTVHLTFLGCPPTLCLSLELLWGQLRFESDPTPVYSCLQGPQLS